MILVFLPFPPSLPPSFLLTTTSTIAHILKGGIDTLTAQSMVAQDCGVTLPRYEGNNYVALLDQCGGHTRDYHFHEELICLYDASASGHSTKVGETLDGQSIYGVSSVRFLSSPPVFVCVSPNIASNCSTDSCSTPAIVTHHLEMGRYERFAKLGRLFGSLWPNPGRRRNICLPLPCASNRAVHHRLHWPKR